jgi:hypothetical protein
MPAQRCLLSASGERSPELIKSCDGWHENIAPRFGCWHERLWIIDEQMISQKNSPITPEKPRSGVPVSGWPSNHRTDLEALLRAHRR